MLILGIATRKVPTLANVIKSCTFALGKVNTNILLLVSFYLSNYRDFSTIEHFDFVLYKSRSVYI